MGGTLLKVGACQKEITPPLGTELSGYVRKHRPAHKIHDPLTANFLWIEDRSTRLLFISVDVLMLEHSFCRRLKKRIASHMNIPEDSILLAATHTHSAPGVHFYRNGPDRNSYWESRLLKILFAGAAEAQDNRRDALFGHGTGNVRIGTNRRESDGPLDTSLFIASFVAENRIPIAVIANYGCHPVVLDEKNSQISSDYIGYFREKLRVRLEWDIPVCFFSGACGDVNPIQRGNFLIAEDYGRRLADMAYEVIGRSNYSTRMNISHAVTKMTLPFQEIPTLNEAEREVMEATVKLRQVEDKGDNEGEIRAKRAHLLWAEEIRALVKKGQISTAEEIEIQSFRMGRALFINSPVEIFAETSNKLREKFTDYHIVPVGCANGYFGYLPGSGSYEAGGYELEEAHKYTGYLPYSNESEGIFLSAVSEIVPDP
ncbi:neutral/alkaline non-lysosomal ceramidase N-terminal domain-containing protein [Acidobacteriota bacterium]